MSAEAWMFELRFNNDLKQCDDGDNTAYVTMGGIDSFDDPSQFYTKSDLILLARNPNVFGVHQYCFADQNIDVSKDIGIQMVIDYLTKHDPQWWWDT